MFEYSLVAGLTASGADAYLLHVTTTPSVAYIARVDDFDCGIMISASHNPYYDNGIKLIDCYGEKMPEETLLLVEDYIDGKLHVFDKDWPELPFAHREHIGCTVDYVSGRNRYMGYLISLGIYSFKGVKVGLDCANGSSWNIAKSVFDALEADTYVINAQPSGTNINNNAGSTHIEGLQKFVVEKGLDIGFAYDGDADRCLCVDEKGNVITGDHILYIYGCYMKERGKLLTNTVVTTVMSNFGLYKAFDEQGIGYAKTAVGDKYVYEYMAKNGCRIGGEQSGHIIFSKYASTGDGNGTVVGEQYFDTDGNPVGSSLGQYGELYQRNEQGYIGQITYLGADGKTTPTNAGYTILKRTYHRDGTADTDMYFDANGNPKALSKGQYGIKRSGDVNLLLDKNGNIMLCVDNLLNGFPCMVVVFGCVVCLLMIILPKSLSVVLTMVYVAFILYETLMFRESGDARTNFILFSYAGKFLKEQSVRVGVINNIWLFIPLGTGLYRWFQKKWGLVIPFVMSVAIETTQYITGLGIAEFDDVFGNTMGGWIGVLVAWTWLSRKMSVKNRA